MTPEPSLLHRWLGRFGLLHPIRDLRRTRRFRRASRIAFREWRRRGCPAPAPDFHKYDCIRDYARRHHTSVMVETGTFLGHALFALRHDFRELHSIEIAAALHARNRYELGHLPHIHLHLGDSTEILPRLLPNLKERVLFWLDGHWCAGPSGHGKFATPIRAELDALFSRAPGQDVVLIDDARCFTGHDDYPSIEELRSRVAAARPDACFEVKDDIIRIVPV